MHFSCHLDQYLRDHGPAYGFWLFPFERMNGLLGDTYTNKHDIAPQFMHHFMNKCTTLYLVHDLPDDLHTAFFPNGLTSAAKRTSGGVHHNSDIVEVTRARLPLQLSSTEGNILDLVTSQRISQAIILSLCTYRHHAFGASKNYFHFLRTPYKAPLKWNDVPRQP